jgi:2-polyprenyl-6-methoxyphenol hydroxylase-like FAD-dependent oxidoreductase
MLIAGAGIGGLTAVLALLRRGLNVEICEPVTKLHELGAGVQIAADGSRVLVAHGRVEPPLPLTNYS